MDDGADLALWERLQAAADASLGLFSDVDVVEAIKASNFNKGLGQMGSTGVYSSQVTPPTPLLGYYQLRSSASSTSL